jgi:hypothetical protein
MDIVTGTTLTTVMDRVHFKMAWLLFIPGDPFCGDLSGYSVGLNRASARQAGLIFSSLGIVPSVTLYVSEYADLTCGISLSMIPGRYGRVA